MSTVGARRTVPAARVVLRSALRARRRLGSRTTAAQEQSLRAGWAGQPAPVGAVVLVGDSLAGRFPVELLAPLGWPVLLRGTPGQSTEELVPRLNRTLPEAARAVVVQTGTADVGRGRRLTALAADHRALLCDLRSRVPRAQIVALSLPPVTPWRADPIAIAIANANLRAAAAAHGADYVDSHGALAGVGGVPRSGMSTDGVHLSRVGYEHVAALLLSALSSR